MNSISLISRLIIVLTLVLLTNRQALPDKPSLPAWNGSDLISGINGVGTLRYSPVGMGAYPYFTQMPYPLDVSVNGIPMRSVSPFGADTELVPYVFADSIAVDPARGVRFFSRPLKSDEPISRFRFHQGTRRRFIFDYSFQRMLSEKSALMIGGESAGIHGGDRSEKNGLRDYIMAYQYYPDRGGTVDVRVNAYRDRDGLFDLDNGGVNADYPHMGERKTDNITFAASYEDLPLTEKVRMTTRLYGIDSNTRFDRFGLRKSLDDNSVGGNVALNLEKGAHTFGVEASYDHRTLDSRIHDDSWTRDTSDVLLTHLLNRGGVSVETWGGAGYSSEYGTTLQGGSKLAVEHGAGNRMIVSGYFKDVCPDMSVEYYTSPTFSDSATVFGLDAASVAVAEAGIEIERPSYGIGIFGFAGRYDSLWRFQPSSIVSSLLVENQSLTRISQPEEDDTVGGYRFNATFHGGERLTYRVICGGYGRYGGSVWPYPDTNASLSGLLNRAYFNGNLETGIEGRLRYQAWDDHDIDPSGGYLFADAGLVLRVKTIKLFYYLENLTSEEISWFNTLGWQGMNGMWGITWTLFE